MEDNPTRKCTHRSGAQIHLEELATQSKAIHAQPEGAKTPQIKVPKVRMVAGR